MGSLYVSQFALAMPSAITTLDALRNYAVARTLFAPTTLPAAIKRLGFVQADPIRAPARAQDLTLRHRVKGYCAGDLERRYAKLGIEEDFFVNYGFMPRATQALMHPRTPRTAWPKGRAAQAQAVLAYVQQHSHEGSGVHPREVDAHFAHGRTTNWFGGTSNASTQLLDDMHYRGLLRIAGRVSGVRTYAVAVGWTVPVAAAGAEPVAAPMQRESHGPVPLEEQALRISPEQAMDALVDVIVHKYAPLPEASLRQLMALLRGGAPQWDALRPAAFARAKQRLASAVVAGTTWYWPQAESPTSARYAAKAGAQSNTPDTVRLLAPFDPLVWDRRRFELLWGWAYRFEAYTPAPKRVRGYYALPLLWRDQVIGWGNVSMADGALRADLGYVAGKAPREAAFKQALAVELDQMQKFLLPKK
jgi:uncharacterized protein